MAAICRCGRVPSGKRPLLILKTAKRGEQHDGGGVEEGSGGFEGCLEVLGEAAVAADPGEEALNDPAPGLDGEAGARSSMTRWWFSRSRTQSSRSRRNQP